MGSYVCEVISVDDRLHGQPAGGDTGKHAVFPGDPIVEEAAPRIATGLRD